ncbi:MAG: Calx-beta domain-containing protein, partial [Pirellulaceae bacterium]
DTTGATTVDFVVTGSGTNPANSGDFGGTFPTNTLSFAAGQASQTVTIDVSGDTNIELNEGFTVTLSNPSGPATITTATAQGTIQDDDGTGGGTTLAIAVLDANKPEGNVGNTPFTFTVTRSGDTTGATTVDFVVTGSGTNTASGNDFTLGTFPTGVVNFAAGQSSQPITIDVIGDTTIEPNENFTVTLSNPSGPATITTATAPGTIQNDDGTGGGTTLAIAPLDANKPEGDFGSIAFTFTVTRSGDTSGATIVDFDVTGSGTNPANGPDFTAGTFPTNSVIFAAGQTSQIVTVNVSGDTALEPSEGFTVTLSNPSGSATITTAAAAGTIQNDDAATTLAIAATDANQAEGNIGNTPFSFTVTRSGDASGTTTVDFAVTGNGSDPAGGDDFFGGTFPTSSIVFIAGQVTQTIVINISGDTTVEPDEGFAVTLASPSAGATITTATDLGTIQNDDVAPPTTLDISADVAVDLEGDAGNTSFTFTVTRGGDTSGATSVDFEIAGSGPDAAGGSDFGGALPTGTVNFAAGQTTQTIAVNVRGDTEVEADEDFTVTLSSASGGATINTDTASGTILNDDELAPEGGSSIEVETLNEPGRQGSADVTDDQDNPGEGALVVTGTSKKDVIIVEPRPGRSSELRVRRNGRTIGFFDASEVQSIVVFGLGGNDVIIVNARLSIDALLFGGSGNDLLFGARGDDGLDGGSGRDKLFGLWGDDRLLGGSGNDFLYGGNDDDRLLGQDGNDFLFGQHGDDVLLGGAGNDRLFGGAHRDLLIGGSGGDKLFGEGHEDVLIGGSTAFDDDGEALDAIVAELTAGGSFSSRVDNLRFGGGENGDITLDDSTLEDDGRKDDLYGGGGIDWFLTGRGDKVHGRARNERMG